MVSSKPFFLSPAAIAIFLLATSAQAQLPDPASYNRGGQRASLIDFRDFESSRGLSTVFYRTRSESVSINTQRQRAVEDAWQQERELIKKTGQGTYQWTEEEKKLILSGDFKTLRQRYHGHHINSVNGHPEFAGNPDNIKFIPIEDHVPVEHGGNTRNPTSGPLINRKRMIRVCEKVVRNQYAIGGAMELGGGILLLTHFGPEAYEDMCAVIDPKTRCERAWLELGFSGSMTASGAGFTASGTARTVAYAVARRAQLSNMHRYLSPLATFSKVAGRFGVVTALAAEGFYGYEWYKGYISTPVFVTQSSALAAATALGIAGAEAGAAVGGLIGGPAAPITAPLGGLIGGIGGGVAGYWGGTYLASSYYDQLDEKSKEELARHIYAKYELPEKAHVSRKAGTDTLFPQTAGEKGSQSPFFETLKRYNYQRLWC